MAGCAQAGPGPAPAPARPPHLPVAVVHAEGNGRGVEEQPEFVLKHFLLETLDGPALALVGFLQSGSREDLAQVPLSPVSHPCSRARHPPPQRVPHPSLTSFCTSLLMAEIFIFMSSSSWSGMTWTCGQCSDSSGEGNTRSARGTYHLQSYCWCFLQPGHGADRCLSPPWPMPSPLRDRGAGTLSPRAQHPPYPTAVFFSLAQSSTSVKRKTCRSFREPSDSSTRKPSLTSCRV